MPEKAQLSKTSHHRGLYALTHAGSDHLKAWRDEPSFRVAGHYVSCSAGFELCVVGA